MNCKTMSWFFAGLLIACATGCGGDGRDDRAPVSGRIAYDGKPVPAGQVMFYPVDGRRMATGIIDASGAYSLTTFDDKDGAFLGKHKVVIDAFRLLAPTQGADGENVSVERLVPEKYANRNSSPLEAQVEDRDNSIDFELAR